MIYELVTVDVIPGKVKEFHDWWLKESLAFFEEHGIKIIGSWMTMIGKSNEVIRLLAYDDLAHVERCRQSFSESQKGLELSRNIWNYAAHIERKILSPC